MNKSAILHIPLSQYAFAEDGNVLTIRLRTAKNDLTECLLFHGDRACRKSPVEFKKVLMERFAWDDEFDYYEAVF